ncbi:CMGC/GSK protein kinase, variant [Aphanomyces invadans]|uniref:CMGC/GSK protein kinase, variant n=1 Tax=Aphanomyces invadans TaxID=157072 RepID=A0A024TZV1_9STRA|nr:CMGC/GSK protein kinase, variant [Aphanomyces invadans]ETV99700.1 CMGC/GSK protein kinase, variant [Aphanomyces invadans]|eukprot:XP_008871476.1 CMGC/GSK protein kinase, variant [Aphanomyces invadans]
MDAEAAIRSITLENSAHVLSDGRTIHYRVERQIGYGSFGAVFHVVVEETGEVVAIKKIFQDKRIKNRELQIMRQLHHANIVHLKHSFYSRIENSDDLYLNLVLEYIPQTIYGVVCQMKERRVRLPLIYVKLYVYQLCCALGYLHSLGICHRDIKPQNVLLHPATHVVKLCDFGSAKMLQPSEPNVSYICSRFYRAPELILGATDYTTAIDVWSLGCVFAELLLSEPLFPVVGTPSRAELEAMNPKHTDFRLPRVHPRLAAVFPPATCPPEALDLLQRMLTYSPARRLHPLAAAAHPFFDELRQPTAVLPNNVKMPPLYPFTLQELSQVDLATRESIVPPHARNTWNWCRWPERS